MKTKLTTITVRLPKKLKKEVIKQATRADNEQDVSKYVRGLIFNDLTARGVVL